MKLTTLRGNEKKSTKLTPYNIDWTGKKVSNPQQKTKDFLFPFFKHDHVLEEFVIPGSRLRIDLFNVSRKIIIEVSPKQHFEYSSFLHGSRINFKDQVKRDDQKRLWAEKNELRFVELIEIDLKNLTSELFEIKFGITL
jgi:hypothetical protein